MYNLKATHFKVFIFFFQLFFLKDNLHLAHTDTCWNFANSERRHAFLKLLKDFISSILKKNTGQVPGGNFLTEFFQKNKPLNLSDPFESHFIKTGNNLGHCFSRSERYAKPRHTTYTAWFSKLIDVARIK
uniref:Uncharacterized protein n=1 Tax=Sphaerodactylus townsendi TaxID=933632 RepID=A0ACB8GDL8_9SAUR